jgi:hypothetical protein
MSVKPSFGTLFWAEGTSFKIFLAPNRHNNPALPTIAFSESPAMYA